MRFHPELETGVLLGRYKRFFADVELADGSTITVHCANTGAMRGCSEPGSRVAFSRHGRSDRTLAGRLEMVCEQGVWIGVYPALANSLVADACRHGRLAGGIGEQGSVVEVVRREVSLPGLLSRFDLELRCDDVRWLVEVKSVSWVEGGVGRFPDAKSTRARRHADELALLALHGERVAMIFCVQRGDVDRVRPAWEVDPEYAGALQRAARSGVTLLAYRCSAELAGITLADSVPVELSI